MDDLFTELHLKMDYASFRKLPRILGYKCEYFRGEAVLVPRPKAVRLKYDLLKGDQLLDSIGYPGIELSQLRPADWNLLTEPMTSAFATIQPFRTMDAKEAAAGVDKCLARTANGRGGELMWDVSVVSRINGNLAGAAIVTISEEVPHLTWLFVTPRYQRMRCGRCLLENVVSKLRADWSCLHSTVRSDNVGALLWHWRLGFEIEEIFGWV